MADRESVYEERNEDLRKFLGYIFYSYQSSKSERIFSLRVVPLVSWNETD